MKSERNSLPAPHRNVLRHDPLLDVGARRCLARPHGQPIAGRDLKNVLADVKALETFGLVESEGEQKERHRKPLRTDFGRIEVHVEL